MSTFNNWLLYRNLWQNHRIMSVLTHHGGIRTNHPHLSTFKGSSSSSRSIGFLHYDNKRCRICLDRFFRHYGAARFAPFYQIVYSLKKSHFKDAIQRTVATGVWTIISKTTMKVTCFALNFILFYAPGVEAALRGLNKTKLSRSLKDKKSPKTKSPKSPKSSKDGKSPTAYPTISPTMKKVTNSPTHSPTEQKQTPRCPEVGYTEEHGGKFFLMINVRTSSSRWFIQESDAPWRLMPVVMALVCCYEYVTCCLQIQSSSHYLHFIIIKSTRRPFSSW